MTPRQTANKVAERQLLRATNKIYSKSGKRKGGFGSAAFHWPFKSSSRRDRIKGRSGPLWWPKIKRQWRFPRLHETTYKVRHWDGPYRKSKVTDAEKDKVQKIEEDLNGGGHQLREITDGWHPKFLIGKQRRVIFSAKTSTERAQISSQFIYDTLLNYR